MGARDDSVSPVLVEVTRGDGVESRHRGSVAVVDIDGGVHLSLGPADLPVPPRSAVKALQALPLVASGAADAVGLDDRALALACASHSGEADHLALVADMLATVGLGVDDLACGPSWPLGEAAARDLARSGRPPTPLHNTCSGKHAGFLVLARALGARPDGYTEPGHPVQIAVRTAIEAASGAVPAEPVVDGCSAPTWPMPLRDLARGFARFGTGAGLPADLATAAERLRVAVAAEPWFVAGTGRFCTEIMALTGPRAFVKFGAEGVFTAAVPELGLGVALKVEDGATRACEVVMAAVLQRLLPDLDLEPFLRPAVRSRRGAVVGVVRPGPVWADLPT